MEGRLFQANSIRTKNNKNNDLCRSSLSLNSLIVRVNYLLKKVELDENLSGLLDEFLEKLQRFNLFISNGIFNANFTEAALLLQSSTELYCKKVDLLWDIIIDYQKCMVSYGKQNQSSEEEIKKLEQRKRKYKRKSKNETNAKLAEAIIHNFSLNTNELNDYINHTYEQNDLTSNWNNFTDNSSNNSNNESSIERSALFLPEDNLYNVDDNEYIGRYDQFHTSSIIPEIFDFNTNQIKIDTNITDDLFELDSNNSYINQEYSPENITIPEKSCVIYLEKLPDNLIEDKLRKSYSFDSGFNQSISPSTSNYYQKCFVYLERLPQKLINDKLKQLKRTGSTSQDSAFFDDFDDRTSLIDNDNNKSKNLLGRSVIQSKIDSGKTNNSNKRDSNCNNDPPLKRRRISKRLLKLSTGKSVSANNFETFYSEHYRGAEGEGVPDRLESLNSEIDNDSDEDNDNQHNLDSSGFDEEIVPNRLELSRIDNNNDEVDDFNSPSISQLNNETHQESEDLPSNTTLREWKAFILPKLKDLEKQQNFDIHQYGATIIESTNISETKLFKDVIETKTSSECARYFFATLQLANTNNIKFSGVQSGQLSNNSLKITVIDKTRYHEFLDDYQAPSEEGFRRKFERIQAMSSSLLHSTPYGGSPAKKLKLIKNSKRLQFS